MAEGTYRIFFADGSTEDVKAENRDQAKNRARTSRLQTLDPGNRMPALDRNSHGSVRIARVAEHGVDQLMVALVAGVAALVWLLDSIAPLAGGTLNHAGVMQVIGASGTAIGATLAALSAVTGDSLTMPFFNEAKKAWMIECWTDVQVAGTARFRSGKWHDDVNGLRFKTIISDLSPLLPPGARQPVYSGDTLHVDLAGSAVAGDVEYVVMLMWFEELSAQAANLITYEQLVARQGNLMTAENTIATGTTPAWTGAEAINADNDQFHARSSYALLGYTVDTECAAVGWSGNDTANVRNGGPGDETQREVTSKWFVNLARATGLPCIPVITADNKSATTVATLQDENGADTVLDSILCELRPA